VAAVTHDVVIVGGSVMGSATAFHLARLEPTLSIAVVEPDPTYARSSTLLSDGNVRIQFNLPENIECSQYAFEVFDRFADDMAIGDTVFDAAPQHQGNLFLADAAGEEAAREGLAHQQRLGADAAWLDAAEIESRWPMLAGPHHVGGTFGPRDGSVDPGAVIRGFARNAVALGVEYVDGRVVEIVRSDGAVAGVRLETGETLTAPVVVCAAGAWSMGLLEPIGVDLPVDPVMRTVYVAAGPDEVATLPSVFLPSGLYMLPEHDGRFLVAWSKPEDPVGFDFTPASRNRFFDLLWPELIDHLPAFDRLEIVHSWAGLYAVNHFDGNAIVGEWPGIRGLHVCTGFSGHGFQQAPAMGRYLAEIITESDHAIDLSAFGPERILRGDPYPEHAGRLI
jgi:glycine/D-amino acid oxidase-like deaminating enzyme